MSPAIPYKISLYNHNEVVEQATGRGNTPKHALLTATLEKHPEAANQWQYEDDADGSGSLVCPDDEHLFYLADPVLEDDPLDAALEACDGEIDLVDFLEVPSCLP